MPPLHAVSAAAPPLARLREVPEPPGRNPPLPALARREGPSATSALMLAFILLALLLQASFFVGLASGRVGGPDAIAAPRAALAP